MIPQIPIVHPERPLPKILVRGGVLISDQEKEQRKMAKAAAAAKQPFTAPNSADIGRKPKAIQDLWNLLMKMDPSALFTGDAVIVHLRGQGPDNRTPVALGLSDLQTKMVEAFATYDARNGGDPDKDPYVATGVFFTIYQMIEAAYAYGRRDEAAIQAKNASTPLVVQATSDDGTEDEDDDSEEEEAPGEDEDLEEVTDEPDEESEDDDNEDDE